MTKRKPCPFCGGVKLNLQHRSSNGGYYRVECNACRARGPIGGTPAYANEAWNQAPRVAESRHVVDSNIYVRYGERLVRLFGTGQEA